VRQRKATTLKTAAMTSQTTNKDETLVIGLVSVSDRASGGVYEDKGIPALQDWLAAALTTPYRIETRLIPDERAQIEATLVELVDMARCHLVLTTGGTGPARRDITPEATLAIGTKEMPGFGEQMRQVSLQFVPTAILSRQTAVIRETADHAALVMNLPGQPKAIKETLEGLKDDVGMQVVGGVFAAVPYCIDLIGGPYMETNPAVCKAFRPKSALRPAKDKQ
jgi:molybdenum cofactor synthesis domain-containing protein